MQAVKPDMRKFMNEKYMVSALFLLVLFCFAFAQEQSCAMQQAYAGSNSISKRQLKQQPGQQPVTLYKQLSQFP